jgi:DedD protein
VQIAAFSAADKARSLRDQLTANGLKSYTESVSTTQGVRTRVRLGPFASRDAADHAKQKLKSMKLDGSVVPL